MGGHSTETAPAEDFEACVRRIAEDFGVELHADSVSATLLFRGESDVYPKTESSMKRFLTGADGYMRPFYEASGFIDFEALFAEHHAEANGLSEEEGVGFVQHYGFPTDLFDLSPSVANTRFFACHGQEDRPIGVVGVFPRDAVEAVFTLTDLSRHPFALRPRRQHAFTARPPPGLMDLKSKACADLTGARWYAFRKSPADLEYGRERLDWTYPSEEELTRLFSQDFLRFFQDHAFYEEMADDQRAAVEAKLAAITGGYRRG